MSLKPVEVLLRVLDLQSMPPLFLVLLPCKHLPYLDPAEVHELLQLLQNLLLNLLLLLHYQDILLQLLL